MKTKNKKEYKMNKKNDIQFYEDNGYLVIEDAIPKENIDSYLKLMADNLTEDKNGLKRGWSGHSSYLAVEESLDILCHENVQNTLEALDKGVALHLELPYWVSTEKKWHQDNKLSNPIAGNNYIGVWVALEDIDANAGPFELIPGSHKWDIDSDKVYEDKYGALGTKPHYEFLQEEIDKREVTDTFIFLPKKGDAVIWHGKLIHRGAPPVDKSLTRKSLIGHYCNMLANNESTEEFVGVNDIISRMDLGMENSEYARWKNGGYYFVDPSKKKLDN
jgi:ectoine hydroxylase-related dioxygenase (phytanoyl-CoA dioxygenase family)